jgi:uncharacterized iron-regulated protein
MHACMRSLIGIMSVLGRCVCIIHTCGVYVYTHTYIQAQFDRNIVAEAIRLACKGIKVENQFIDIKNIAKQYLEFFNEVNRL